MRATLAVAVGFCLAFPLSAGAASGVCTPDAQATCVISAKTHSTKVHATAADVLLRTVQNATADQRKYSKRRRASAAAGGYSPWFHCYCTDVVSSTGPFLGHCTCRWHISNCTGATTVYGDGSEDEPYINCL